MSERERELEIRKLKQSLARKDQYFTTTSTSNNNPYKTAVIILFGIIGIGCFTGIVYLIGRQNSGRRNSCKC